MYPRFLVGTGQESSHLKSGRVMEAMEFDVRLASVISTCPTAFSSALLLASLVIFDSSGHEIVSKGIRVSASFSVPFVNKSRSS